MKRGIATFTLDTGKCPRWLFERMVKLGREITRVIIEEYGPNEYIKRVADPAWFQSLGTVLAFDWNASGLTTILTAALKEAIRGQEREFGIFIAGGKGKTSLKTPDEIGVWGDRLSLSGKATNNLIYNSKMSAKVDSSLVQDNYTLYHHSFFFSKNGAWTVVQQGMNKENQTARRYHWHSENVKSLICEPHSAIISSLKAPTLNLTAKDSETARETSIDLIDSGYNALMKDIRILRRHSSEIHQTLSLKFHDDEIAIMKLANAEFKRHSVELENLSKSRYLEKILAQVCRHGPKTYEEFLALRGVGAKTARALTLVAEVIYGAQASYEDPARYSFAHGGVDATPYPVDRPAYDSTIEMMKNVVGKTKLAHSEKKKIIQKLELKI